MSKNATERHGWGTKREKDAVVECFSELLDVTSFTHNKDNNNLSRENLILSLNLMAKVYEKHLSSSGDDSSRNDMTRLLKVEEAARDLRESIDKFLQDLIYKQSLICTLCQELESICREHDDIVCFVLFCRSLASEFLRQSYFEENTIKTLLGNLSNLYVEQNLQQVKSVQGVTDFRCLAQILDNRLQGPHHEHSVMMLDALRGYRQIPSLEIRQHNHSDDEGKCNWLVQTKNELAVYSKMDMHTAKTAKEVVENFLNHPSPFRFQKLLLVGPEGCGKTYICNEIESMAEESEAQVIRPLLLVDVLGISVGATEDVVVSLFNCAMSMGKRCVLILDDVTELIGSGPTFGNDSITTSHSSSLVGEENHQSIRAQSSFLSMIDSIEQQRPTGLNLLLVCTGRTNLDESIARFDRIIFLEPPNEKERRDFLLCSFGMDEIEWEKRMGCPNEKMEIEHILSGLVSSTIRMSYAELSQYIRQAIVTVSSQESIVVSSSMDHNDTSLLNVLRTLKGIVQSICPTSLRNIIVDDFIEMRISTASDLLASFDGDHATKATPGKDNFPFFGSSQESAWEDLQAHIVTPLCRGTELQQLLNKFNNKSGSGSGIVCGGVLLTGPPGSGKTAMASYCAMIAAQYLPSLKLLEASCTSLINKEVGSSERAVRRLFDCARSATPCILLMDDISSVAAVRGNDYTTEGTMDRVLSTVLTEIDGVNNEREGEVFGEEQRGGLAIIGITLDANWIDPALKRPGRFDKVILLDLPDMDARVEIVQHEFRNFSVLPFPVEKKNHLAHCVAKRTSGMSAASVIALCNEVKLLCLQEIKIVSIDNETGRQTQIYERLLSLVETP